MVKNKEIKEHYSEWMKSSEAVKKLKEGMVKVGYPLESKAKDILKAAEYNVSAGFYEQGSPSSGGKVWREIDIYASRDILKWTHGCSVNFRIVIIGECKYSSTNDFFAFGGDQTSLGLSFPTLYNFKSFFQNELSTNSPGDLSTFPMIIDKISEVDVKSNIFHGDNLVLHDACLQISNALEYYYSKYQKEVLNDMYTGIYQRTKNYPLGDNTSSEASKGEEYVTYMFEKYLRNVEKIEITIAVFLIVIGENNGLIQVRLKDGLVQDFQDIGYGLYLFTPEMLSFNLEKIIRPTKRLPIIVSNVEKLPEVLKEIRKVCNRIIYQWMEKWYVYPFGVQEEIYSFINEQKDEGISSFINEQKDDFVGTPS